MSAPGDQQSSGDLQRLLALNDELLILSRSGVPLEKSLVVWREEERQLSQTLADRVVDGESLEQIVSDPSLPVPPLYRSVVLSGLRSGRLAEVVQRVGASYRRIAKLRANLNVTTLYVAVMALLAYGAILLIILQTTPIVLQLYRDVRAEDHPWAQLLQWTVDYRWIWLPGLPLAGLLIWLVLRLRLGSKLQNTPGLGQARFSTVRVIRLERLAVFADLLALLLDNQVPLDEALMLASGSCGDQRLQAAAATMAERLRVGTPAAEIKVPEFPALIGWIVRTESAANLPDCLDRIGALYAARADTAQRNSPFFSAPALSAAIGAVVVGAFAILVFAPWCTLIVLFLDQI